MCPDGVMVMMMMMMTTMMMMMVMSSCDVQFLGRRVAAGGVGSAVRIVLLRLALAHEPLAARCGAQILGT